MRKEIDKFDRLTEQHRQTAEFYKRQVEQAQKIIAQQDLVRAEQTIAGAETAAEAELRAALEHGNADGLTSAQKRIGEIAAHKVELNRTRAQPQQQISQPADPVEAVISTRTQPTPQWLREHRDWLKDEQKKAKLTAAHYDALAEGLQPDTSNYFKFVEKKIGLKTDGGEIRRTSAEAKKNPAQL